MTATSDGNHLKTENPFCIKFFVNGAIMFPIMVTRKCFTFLHNHPTRVASSLFEVLWHLWGQLHLQTFSHMNANFEMVVFHQYADDKWECCNIKLGLPLVSFTTWKKWAERFERGDKQMLLFRRCSKKPYNERHDFTITFPSLCSMSNLIIV